MHSTTSCMKPIMPVNYLAVNWSGRRGKRISPDCMIPIVWGLHHTRSILRQQLDPRIPSYLHDWLISILGRHFLWSHPLLPPSIVVRPVQSSHQTIHSILIGSAPSRSPRCCRPCLAPSPPCHLGLVRIQPDSCQCPKLLYCSGPTLVHQSQPRSQCAVASRPVFPTTSPLIGSFPSTPLGAHLSVSLPRVAG